MVEIDEIDVKILRELIKDARARLKDIAECCGVSSTAILNRIKRLKAAGVITGAALFINMSLLVYMYPVSIGINLDPSRELQVIRLIRERASSITLSQCVGKYNLSIFSVARSIKEIDNLKQSIRKQQGIKQIAINLWSTPYLSFENIDLKPTRV
jgi:DNA-binding Lrp family transcriptional regulator